jgi:hypothetical protein
MRSGYIVAISATLLANVAVSAEVPSSRSIVCAQREALLMTLVEAYSAAPNFVTELAPKNLLILQARGSCDNGHITDAVALYDRLIAELNASLKELK